MVCWIKLKVELATLSQTTVRDGSLSSSVFSVGRIFDSWFCCCELGTGLMVSWDGARMSRIASLLKG